MKKGYRVTVVWIPSHIEISGNEEADKAAEKAAKQKEKRDPR